jgi:heme exporter protein D
MLIPMDKIASFLAMGGYAGYVWPASAIAAVVMIGLAFATIHRLRRREAELAALEKGRPGR